MKTHKTIRNCPTRWFERICPLKWEALERTAEDTQRFCGSCDRLVYLCSTDEETLEHARAGHCIAREIPDESEMPEMYLGEPVDPSPTTESQEKAFGWAMRERGIDDALKNMGAPRACPECSYPVQTWRSECRVCGYEIGRVRRSDAAEH